MNEPILTADALVKHYPVKETPFAPAGTLKAVDGVDLTLREGETLGLAGESGCGKSTVGKLLMGLAPPTSGTIRFRGKDMREFGKGDWGQFRREVQMIFQDPYASLNPRMRIGDVIAEPLTIHRLVPRNKVRDRVLELMRQVGLREEHYDRYPHEFSGGQRQRAGIARALAVSPRLIIADEPVSALDLSIQAQIINLLEELKTTYSLSFLFVAHDLSVVRHISDRIAIMYLGRIMETGSRDQVFDRFLHPYTECLLSAVPQADPERRSKRIILKGDLPSPVNPPSGCPFHTRCPYAEQVCIDKRPPLEEKEQGHRAACHFSIPLYRK